VSAHHWHVSRECAGGVYGDDDAPRHARCDETCPDDGGRCLCICHAERHIPAESIEWEFLPEESPWNIPDPANTRTTYQPTTPAPVEPEQPLVGPRVLWAALAFSTIPLLICAGILFAASRNPIWLAVAIVLAVAGAVGVGLLWIRGEEE
jgi:hypothetical protein